MTPAEAYLEIQVDPEDPSSIEEGADIGTELTPGDDGLTDIRQQYEIRRLGLELQQLQVAVQNNTDQYKLRKTFSWLLLCLTLLWIATVCAFVAFQGLGVVPGYWWLFSLSDAVLIAFITSTTASVLGLFGIAAYWLFGTKKPTG